MFKMAGKSREGQSKIDFPANWLEFMLQHYLYLFQHNPQNPEQRPIHSGASCNGHDRLFSNKYKNLMNRAK
jgi:hypothetical protein